MEPEGVLPGSDPATPYHQGLTPGQRRALAIGEILLCSSVPTQILLGALLANNKAYERVSEFLEAEHFADAIHGRIYSAIRRRVENGQLADAVTLRREFEHTGELTEVGGPAYLAQLLSAMVGIVNAGDAIEFLIAGATAVGVGTALFYDPLVCPKINRGIAEYLVDQRLSSIRELRVNA